MRAAALDATSRAAQRSSTIDVHEFHPATRRLDKRPATFNATRRAAQRSSTIDVHAFHPANSSRCIRCAIADCMLLRFESPASRPLTSAAQPRDRSCCNKWRSARRIARSPVHRSAHARKPRDCCLKISCAAALRIGSKACCRCLDSCTQELQALATPRAAMRAAALDATSRAESPASHALTSAAQPRDRSCCNKWRSARRIARSPVHRSTHVWKQRDCCLKTSCATALRIGSTL